MDKVESMLLRVGFLEKSLCDTPFRDKMDELIPDLSAQFFYKKYNLLKSSLVEAKKTTDELYFIFKQLSSMKFKGWYNIFPYNRYFTQLSESKQFIDNLLRESRNSTCTSWSNFTSKFEAYNPKDEVLINASLPWNIYTAAQWFMLTEWNKTKRVFSVDFDWLDYLLDSVEDDMTLQGISSCPYNTFGVIEFGEFAGETRKVANMVVHLDREGKQLYVSAFTPQHNISNEEYETLLHVVIDISGTCKNAMETLKVYSIDDSTTFSLFFSSSCSYWRTLDFSSNTATSAYFSSNTESGADIIKDEDCGRFRSGIMARARTCQIDEDHSLHVKNTAEFIASHVLALTLFLSAENSEKSIVKRSPASASSKPTDKKAERKQKKPHKPIETYDVAVREVSLLRKEHMVRERTSFPTASLERSPVRPHMRKAHWHHYWTGKRGTPDRKLVLRFLMPTLVGGTESVFIDNTTLSDGRKNEE